MKKAFFILITLSFTLLSINAYAQYEDDNYYDKPKNNKEKESNYKPVESPQKEDVKKEGGFDKSKLSVGGFFGVGFGDVIFVNVSPVVAYKPIERMQVGVGFIYQYYNYRNYPPPDNKASLYGLRIFDRIFIWDQLFAQIEYLMINGEVYYYDKISVSVLRQTRMTFNTFFIGGGYNIPMGANAYMSLQMLVNINTNYAYPKRQPLFSIGFGVSL